MAVVIPSAYDLRATQDIRIQRKISGGADAEVRLMVDNATRNFAVGGVLCGMEPAEYIWTESPTLETLWHWQTTAHDNTLSLVWHARITDGTLTVTYHDSLYLTSVVAAATQDPGTGDLTVAADISWIATDPIVNVDVALHRTAGATRAELHSLSIREVALTVAELPT